MGNETIKFKGCGHSCAIIQDKADDRKVFIEPYKTNICETPESKKALENAVMMNNFAVITLLVAIALIYYVATLFQKKTPK